MIAAKPGLKDLALTTNGVLLADQIDALKAAGLGRITVSLDTLHRGSLQGADPLRSSSTRCTPASPRRTASSAGSRSTRSSSAASTTTSWSD